MKNPQFKIFLRFDESGDIPKEIHVIPVGEWDHPAYGQIKIAESDIAEFVENFNAGLRNDIPINEGHEVMDEKPAIGWFKKLVNKGSDGLWAVVEWTEQGKDLLRQKAYKYFSPEFYQQYEDPETRRVYNNVLVGGALTNKPYFKELTPVVFSEPRIINHTVMDLSTIRLKAASELSAEETTFLKEHKAELTTDEVAKFSEALGEEPAPAPAPAPEPAPAPAPAPEKKEMSESVKISASELAALRKQADEGAKAFSEMRQMKFAQEVKAWSFNEATKTGKIAPKSKDKVVTFMMSLNDSQLTTFREIVTELPDALTFAELGESGADIPATAVGEVEAKIAEKIKIDASLTYAKAANLVFSEHPELFRRYNAEIEKGQE